MRHDKRHQAFFPLTRCHADGCLDAFQAVQGCVDFTQFDAVATDLDLLVATAEEFQRSVRPVTAHVAGAVPAFAGHFDELPCAAFGVVEIAVCNTHAADPKLAGDPVRAVAAQFVNHPITLVGQRRAIGDRAPVRLNPAHGAGVGPDGRFRRTTHGNKPTIAAVLVIPLRQVQADPVAGQHHQPQARRAVQIEAFAVGQQHVQQGRYAVPQGNAVFIDQLAPQRRVATLLVVDQHQRSTCAEYAEDVIHRQVKMQRRQRQHTVLGADRVALADVHAGVQGALMADHHALGFTGRA